MNQYNKTIKNCLTMIILQKKTQKNKIQVGHEYFITEY